MFAPDAPGLYFFSDDAAKCEKGKKFVIEAYDTGGKCSVLEAAAAPPVTRTVYVECNQQFSMNEEGCRDMQSYARDEISQERCHVASGLVPFAGDVVEYVWRSDQQYEVLTPKSSLGSFLT